MANETKTLMHCSRFEEVLTDYLDRTLDAPTYKAAAEHAMACPLCHSLLNDVKGALAACRDMAEPKLPVTRLEAKILARTTPEAAIHCAQFEESLTDYLDGFLPAQVYHRWERHAVGCRIHGGHLSEVLHQPGEDLHHRFPDWLSAPEARMGILWKCHFQE